MKNLTHVGNSGGPSARLNNGGSSAALKRPALASTSPVAALEPSASIPGAPVLKASCQRRRRRACKGKAPSNAPGCVHGKLPGKDEPEDAIDELLKLIGPAVLLELKRGSKRPDEPWKHLTLDKQTPERLGKLRRHAEGGGNIGVALGEVSQGLIAIDFDTEPEAQEFLACNPKLQTSLRTRGARGCQIWVRIAGDIPKSAVVKHHGSAVKRAEWRASGNQSVVRGTHPNGNEYQRLVNAPPVTLRFDEIVWPAGWIVPAYPAKGIPIQTHNHTEKVPLYGGLYGCSPVDAIKEAEVTHVGKEDVPAKPGYSTLEQAHPKLPAFYEERIRRKHTPRPRERYSFLLAAVPFLHCAVAKQIMLLCVEKYYEDNAAIFRDSLQTHLQEAAQLWDDCEESFLVMLTAKELGIHRSLAPSKKDAFRICRRFALGKDGNRPQQSFHLSCNHLCTRLGKLEDKFAWHLFKDFRTRGILERTEKGTAHAPGMKGKASVYRWNLL